MIALSRDCCGWPARSPVLPHPEQCVQVLMEQSGTRNVVALKPHGCISIDSSSLLGFPSPWWHNVPVMTWTYSSGFRALSPDGTLPTRCPFLADLVPPGHGAEHVADPGSNVRDAVKVALRGADLVVNWGLSMAPPDRSELATDLQWLRPGSQAALIGNVDERGRSAVELLHANAGGVQVFDYNYAGHLERAKKWIERQRIRRPVALKRVEALRDMLGTFEQDYPIAT
jgi:hypothetical protein